MHKIPAEPFQYKLTHKYPGMRPKDEVIWDKFIQKFPDIFKVCYYNVPVGDPSRDDFGREEMQLNGAWGVSTWRIDVVAEADDEVWVIELKPHADTHSIGEVLAYRALLIAEGKITDEVKSMIITDEASMIFQQACNALGIAWVQV